MTEKKLHSVEDKPVSKFSPDVLRRPQDFAARAGVKKLIRTIPVRKPLKQDFVRTRPELEYRVDTSIIELKEDREIYAVAPDLREELIGETADMLLVTAINRRGVLFLWPIRLPAEDGKTNEWNRSSMDAAEIAQTRWIRVQSNMSLGAYEALAAVGELLEPEWPNLTFEEILAIAFRDRYIDGMDHPVVQNLLGLN